MHTFLQDLRFGVRVLTKNPGFTLVAVVALALGIGANTAVFSVVNAVLLRPLPYQHSDQLVVVLHDGDNPVAPANFLDWQKQTRTLEAMGASEYWVPSLTGTDQPEKLWALHVSANLLPMLGVQPVLGRVFAPEDETPGNEHKIVISHALWQSHFAGSRDAIGKTATLNGENYTVIGVMPPQFKFAPFWATKATLWAPMVMAGKATSRDANTLRIFARLRPEASIDQARAEMATITARLEKEFPGTNRDVQVVPLKEKVVGNIRPALLVLLGAVAFVLLIACANVAHMMLARAASRQREMAVRTALGASRSRIIRQLFTESSLLALLGAGLGLLLGIWGIRTLVALNPENIPTTAAIGLDAHVLLFVLGISLFTGVLFGFAPAIQSSMFSISDALKESGRGSGEGIFRNRFRSALVASEVALAMVLLVGAGLMIRSFIALQNVDPGFDPRNVLSMTVSLAGTEHAGAAGRVQFYQELLHRMEHLPGVQSVSAINHLPIAGDIWGFSFSVEGRPLPKPGESPNATYRVVYPGYFKTMDIPVLHGRDITEGDNLNTPSVVVINEELARRYWPGEDAIGKRITLDDFKPEIAWVTVVGVVKNTVRSEWTAPPAPEFYLPYLQNRMYLENPGGHVSYMTLVARTAGNPLSVMPSIRNEVSNLDKNAAIAEVQTMEQVIRDATVGSRFYLVMLGSFAAIALVLAAVGIYGVMSYSVSRRTREIGVRMALGAKQTDVLRLIIGQGMTLVLLGAGAGIAGALALGRLMTTLLYGIRPTDPATFVAVSLVLSLVAAIASYIPARRAARVDPMVALRYE